MQLQSKRLTLFSVSLALFMDVLDTNIINTSIPMMAKSLQVSAIDLKIALISYLLSLAIFIPTSGWAADRYGPKRIFIAAFGLFTVSSFFCGYAHHLYELIIARSIQGMGGAFMISLGRLIIVRTFKRHELVDAMNTVIIVVSVAAMIGPFIGGFITEHWSWPWIFWVNIPVGIIAMGLTYLNLQDNHPRRPRPFDLLGFILFGGSLSLLCFSLSELSESHANLFLTRLFVLISLAMLVIYILHAKKIVHPVINIKLFKIRTFRISVLGNLCARLGFGGMPFLLPLLQQIGLGFSPQLSGLLLAPIAFGVIISKLFSSVFLRRFGYRKYLMINTSIVACILWAFTFIQANTSILTIIFLTFALGISLAAQYTGMNSLAFSDIDEEQLSASTSITSTTQILGQSLGVAAAAILLRFFSTVANQTTVLTPHHFHQTFIALGILTILSSLIFMGLKPSDGNQMLLRKLDNSGTP